MLYEAGSAGRFSLRRGRSRAAYTQTVHWCLLLMVGIVGCGTPEHHPRRAPRVAKPKSTEPMNASADREHPVAIADATHTDYDGVALDVRTPSAGSWWFALTVSPVRKGLVADGVANVQVFDKSVKLFVVEGPAEQRGEQRLDLPTPSEGRYLLRADTQGPTEFSLEFSRSLLLAPPPPPGPNCDPDHIDHANPNCAGVYPRCNRDRPDYKNPNCCIPACGLHCKTVVTKVETNAKGSDFEIGIGADQEIMYGARARISRERYWATGIVMGVNEHTSLVILDEPGRPNMDKLLGAPVELEPPADCIRH